MSIVRFSSFLSLGLLLICGGCSFLSSGTPPAATENTKAEALQTGPISASSTAPFVNSVKEERSPLPSLIPLISQEGGKYFSEALAQWQEDECLNPAWALRLLDAVLEECPDYIDALIWRGKALSAANYLEDAFDDLTRAIRLLDGLESETARQWRARAYAARALVALRMERQKGAERDLDSAQEAWREEGTIYLYRAALHFLRNEKRAGCEALEEACSFGFCKAGTEAEEDGLCR